MLPTPDRSGRPIGGGRERLARFVTDSLE